MNQQELLSRIEGIKSWSANGKRAPHKPLLILYALGQFEAGNTSISYEGHKEALKSLLEEFGPPTHPRPYYPFTRLANDGLWDVNTNRPIDLSKDYSNKLLVEMNAKGMFTPEIRSLLESHPQLISEVAEFLLTENFPETLHEDILQAVGLDLDYKLARVKKARDPNFRKKILEAYEYSCAVCGYQIRRDNQIIGLEAAHIKWHQAGGPDVEQNGIAMCTMHHKLFDHGLFALDKELILRVSKKANGGFGFQEWLLNYHGKQLRKPQSTSYYPDLEFTLWQVNEVFKGGFRD